MNHDGGASRRNRQIVAAMLPAACYRCGGLVTADDDWHADHIVPLVVTGEQTPGPDMLAPSHARCNTRHGAQLRHERVRAKANADSRRRLAFWLK